MQSETPQVHTPLELPNTPDTPDTPSSAQFPKTPDGSPKEGIAPATPFAIVDEKLRVRQRFRFGNVSAYASSSSNNGATNARNRLPLIPEGTVWNKAHGLIQPIFAPLKTYEELRAAVDKCKHPDVKALHGAFDCYINIATIKKRGRESENAVCWNDIYAKYIFLACEYFLPRLCYTGPSSEYPNLFQHQLPRDEAISCILSFLTGEVVDKKMVTSHMQQLKKTFEGQKTNKTTWLRRWQPLQESYLGTPNKNDSGKGKARATPRQATNSARDHVLHPFLAYLLGLNPTFFNNPITAFSQPAMDVSHVEMPRAFWNIWDARRDELRLQAEATKARAAEKAGRERNGDKARARDTASSTRTGTPQTPTPARSSIKRKRSDEIETPSKKRVVFTSEAVSEPACRGFKLRNTAKASTVTSYADDDENDELDSSEYGSSSDDDSDDFVSVASGTPTTSSARMRALVSACCLENSLGSTHSSLEMTALSAGASTAVGSLRISDNHSDGSASESFLDIVLDGASSHRVDRGYLADYLAREVGLSEREIEAVNGLLDFGRRWRVDLDLPPVDACCGLPAPKEFRHH